MMWCNIPHQITILLFTAVNAHVTHILFSDFRLVVFIWYITHLRIWNCCVREVNVHGVYANSEMNFENIYYDSLILTWNQTVKMTSFDTPLGILDNHLLHVVIINIFFYINWFIKNRPIQNVYVSRHFGNI